MFSKDIFLQVKNMFSNVQKLQNKFKLYQNIIY